MEPTPSQLPYEDLVRHADFLRRLAQSIVRDAHAADDLVQDTLVRALERPPRVAEETRGWLARVLRNLAFNSARRDGRRRRREQLVAKRERIPSHADATARIEIERCLLSAVQGLPEPYKRTLYAQFYEERTSSAIAAEEGIPQATVRTRLARGLARVRVELDAAHDGRRDAWLSALVPMLRFPGPRRVDWAFLPAWDSTGKLVAGGTALAVAALLLLPLAVPGGAHDLREVAAPAASAAFLPMLEIDAGRLIPASRRAEAQAAPAMRVEPDSFGGAGTLTLEVRDADGAPLADVGLIVERAPLDPDPRSARFVSTDALGTATLAGLAPGRVRVTSDRGACRFVALDGESGAHLRIDLEGRERVEGMVVDDAGVPIGGAQVELQLFRAESKGPEWLHAQPVATSDTSGRFTLEAIPRAASLAVRAEGRALSLLEPVAELPSDGSARRARFVLSGAGRSVCGQVRDDGGRAIAGAVVGIGVLDFQE